MINKILLEKRSLDKRLSMYNKNFIIEQNHMIIIMLCLIRKLC